MTSRITKGRLALKPKKVKPFKPYPEYPLYAHASGSWAKKIKGRIVYFGPWSDPDGALESYLKQRDYLYAGQIPPPAINGVTLDELVNRYLATQENKLCAGSIGQRHFRDCLTDGARLLEVLARSRPVESLRPNDFTRLRMKLTAGRNATTITNSMTRIRQIFKWGAKTSKLHGEIDYGGEFTLPTLRERRRAMRQGGSKILTADQINGLLDATEKNKNLHAMILLGINAALGNTDCSELSTDHIDFKKRILDFPRPKTETQRRAILWPETIKAVKAALAARPEVENPAGRVFLTRNALPYVRFTENDKPINSIAINFRRWLKAVGCHRKGLGFYSLRHTFRTVADEIKDFPAIDLVMGHSAENSPGAPHSIAMASRYRDSISNERLAEVSDYVHDWLFGSC